MSSDIAAIRQQIALECEAMKQALWGYAAVSKHEIIAHRFEALGKHQERLTASVGAQEAQRILYEAYEHVFDTPDG